MFTNKQFKYIHDTILIEIMLVLVLSINRKHFFNDVI